MSNANEESLKYKKFLRKYVRAKITKRTNQIQSDEESDLDWMEKVEPSAHIRSSNGKLSKGRATVVRNYDQDFLPTVIEHAINEKGRYKPLKHHHLFVGDIVLIKDPMSKPINYPLAIVESTVMNDLGEITTVKVRKGNSREILTRHVNSIVPLLRKGEYFGEKEDSSGEAEASSLNGASSELVASDGKDQADSEANERPIRKSALDCRNKTRRLFDEDLA